jgi:purine-cytosine permease-like protein
VVIAGLTTANPTIYRAGLALQSVRPQWKTWKVTMVVGAVTAAAAVFPALVMKLLEFVALYGLLLMPMGAVVVMDVYVLPRLGLVSDAAERFGRSVNPAAAIAWGVTLAACLCINLAFGLEVFFLGLPGWFIAAILYVAASLYLQRSTAGRRAAP